MIGRLKQWLGRRVGRLGNPLRLLPVVMVAAVALLGVKLERLWHGLAVPLVSTAPANAATGDEAKTEASPPAAAEQAPAATAEEGRVVRPVSTAARFTAAEVEVLQNLSERRQQLEERAANLRTRENLLAATEKRIDEKIVELKQLEGQIQALLKQHDEQTEARMRSLVKVYENMKPKDAARIFEQLDMDILLDVTGRMRETKMAAILADMDPSKAKEVTVELASRRRLPETGG